MNRIDRLLGIITTLQSKKYVTAEKIAEKYNISIRTVYRDVKAIAEQGIPVSFEQGKGYFLVQGFFLPPVSFTPEEANAFLLMNAVVERFSDKTTLKHYSSGLDKIKSVMRSSQKEQLDMLQEHIRLQTSYMVAPEVNYLSPLQTAISNKHIVEFTYKNKEGITSKRKAEPLGLIFYAYNWHLIAWCYRRNEYRDFRVSSIVDLKTTAEPFRKKNHIQLGEYMKELPVKY